MKKKLWFWIIFISALLLLVLYFFLNKSKVSAVKSVKSDYVEKILVTGTVQGKEFSTLASGIDGTVEKIYVREGNPVKKDQLVAKLDTKKIEADIAQAEAVHKKSISDLERIDVLELQNAQAELSSAQIAHSTAKDEYQKYQKLYDKRYATELEYNAKKNSFIASEARLKNAHTQLDSVKNGATRKAAVSNVEASKQALDSLKNTLIKYYVYAPYDGFITVRNVEIGQSIGPYTEMFIISSSEDKIVMINLDEKYIGRVTIDSPIKIYPYADTSKFSSGKIYYIGIDVDDTKGTVEIKGTIDHKYPEFLYNSTVNVIIQGRKVANGILLQEIYTVPIKEKIYVYIIKNSRTHLQQVKGISVIDGFLVTEGLNEGDIVLLPKNLKEGVFVKPQIKDEQK